ncbi:hypothetical protein H0H81_005831 [Sphagnurus paluster]|uniref:Uncharacterized protein n=1 Tax=Sphagnurus paluster TaxID=117069 RepID=A0A9P7GRN1_9AGAR|nr:hypothetical protein H0H81_005831 [Sphagnurus paluster]
MAQTRPEDSSRDQLRFIVHGWAAELSRHRLVWNKETSGFSITTWEANIPIDAAFNIWQHVDDEAVLFAALDTIKPIFASEPGQARHCTFVGPYSLTHDQTQLFTSALISTGLFDHASHFAVHSAIINGLRLPLNTGDLSSIAIVFPDETSFIVSPEDRANSQRRQMYAHETTLTALTSDMRKIEQIILLENELVKPSDYTPHIRRETLDVIARGASFWASLRGSGTHLWFTLGPPIGIAVLDSDGRRVVHPILGHPASVYKTGQAIITTIADRQSSIEVQVLYDEIPLTSLVLHGIPAMAAGTVEIIFSVVTVPVDEDGPEVILQLVHLSSGIRVSKQVLLGKSRNSWREGPTQVNFIRNFYTPQVLKCLIDRIIKHPEPTMPHSI